MFVHQIRYLWEMGTRIQVNAGSITGDSGRSAKKFVKQLLGEHMVHCVGTDAHGVDHRQPKMKKAAEHVERKYGEDRRGARPAGRRDNGAGCY